MRLAISRKGAVGLDRRMLVPEIEWQRSPLSRVLTIRQRCVVAQKKWSNSKTIPTSTLPSSRIRSFAGDEQVDAQTEADLESFFSKGEREDVVETPVPESESPSPSSEELPGDDELEDWLEEEDNEMKTMRMRKKKKTTMRRRRRMKKTRRRMKRMKTLILVLMILQRKTSWPTRDSSLREQILRTPKLNWRKWTERSKPWKKPISMVQLTILKSRHP